MDSQEKFDKTTILSKESFYSKLNLEDMNLEEFAFVKKVWKVFEIKNRGGYHNLYVLCDTLLLADIFETFRDKCIKIYEIDPAHFVSAPGLAWQASLKKTEVKLELITDYDMFMMVEKGV